MLKKVIAIIACVSGAFIFTAAVGSNEQPYYAERFDAQPPEVQTITVMPTYTYLDVPSINSSFKTYMDYRTITDKTSPQYNFIQAWGWCDENGFMRATGERDLGITDDYYMIALGSYYGTEIGTKYKITTDMGNVFYGVLCDQKDNAHTNSTHQYSYNNDVVEVIVDTRCLRSDVKRMGSANVYMPLNGSIAKIERIDF